MPGRGTIDEIAKCDVIAETTMPLYFEMASVTLELRKIHSHNAAAQLTGIVDVTTSRGACSSEENALRLLGREVAMVAVINFLNTIFWGYVLIYGLWPSASLHHPARLHPVPAFQRDVPRHPQLAQTDEAGITPFQALTVSLASRVGAGNIAGVAVASTWRAGCHFLDVDGRPGRHGDRLFREHARPSSSR
ncbi:MAG: alanine:cation symporter family protein [Geminicoccaceae bacterium]